MTISSLVEEFIQNDKRKGDLLFVSTVFGSIIFYRGLLYIVRWFLYKDHFFKKYEDDDNKDKIFVKEDGKTVKYVRHFENHKKYYFDVEPSKRWKITNEIVSLVHSIICGLWILCVFFEFSDILTDYEYGFSYNGAVLCMMSFGYFLSDTADTIVNSSGLKIIELVAHHVLASIGVFLPFTIGKYMQLVLMGLIMEVNSIFLHIRILMLSKGVNKKRKIYRTVSVLTVITFLIFRIFPSIYLVILFFHFFTSGGSESVAATILIAFIVFGLLISNNIMFARLIKADFFKNKKNKKSKSKNKSESKSKSKSNKSNKKKCSLTTKPNESKDSKTSTKNESSKDTKSSKDIKSSKDTKSSMITETSKGPESSTTVKSSSMDTKAIDRVNAKV